LFGKAPWVEVQYRDEESMFLNLGRKPPAAMPVMPASWREEKRMWIVLWQEADRLAEWINRFLTTASGTTDYGASAYIER
jgi:hypothetical protein